MIVSIPPAPTPPMKRRTALLLLGLLTRFACAAPESTARHVEAVFFELSQLRAMQPRERYRLPAEGELLAGGNDDFLRRRAAAEVRTSGLSCGGGDYAIVFIDLIRPRGVEALLNLRKVNGEWVARVGLRSACSASYLTYFEQTIRAAIARL